MTNATAAAAEKPQTLKVSLEVEIKLSDELTILQATEKANALLTAAKAIGTATGNLIFGRQRYPL